MSSVYVGGSTAISFKHYNNILLSWTSFSSSFSLSVPLFLALLPSVSLSPPFLLSFTECFQTKDMGSIPGPVQIVDGSSERSQNDVIFFYQFLGHNYDICRQ